MKKVLTIRFEIISDNEKPKPTDSGQFRASNSMHSSVDVCFSCFPILLIDCYLLKAGKYSL